MNVLGIESSCDETSVAILKDGKLASNLISSQTFHLLYGGVVPELSSRAHLKTVVPLTREALLQSSMETTDLDLICATQGPGLIGALLVGLTYAKALAYSLNLPFVPVNHVEGHVFSGFLMEEKPEFPYLCLNVSGGHSLLLIVKSDLEIIRLGGTIDDAAGEAFDKVSKMIGLGYPGGPKIQEYAKNGIGKVKFPVARLKSPWDFSFSGLKTSVLRYIQKNFPSGVLSDSEKSEVAASFQKAIVRALISNVEKALRQFPVKSLALTGGVAANGLLRSEMTRLSNKYKMRLVIPDLSFCGDNAAMIAYRGLKLFEEGKRYSFRESAYPSIRPGTFLKIQETN